MLFFWPIVLFKYRNFTLHQLFWLYKAIGEYIVACVYAFWNVLLVDLNVNGKVLLNIFLSFFPFSCCCCCRCSSNQITNVFSCSRHSCSHSHCVASEQWWFKWNNENVFYLVIFIFSVFCIQCFHSMNRYKCKQVHTIPIYFKTSLTPPHHQWSGYGSKDEEEEEKKTNQQEMSRSHCIIVQVYWMVFALGLASIFWGMIALNLNLTTAM